MTRFTDSPYERMMTRRPEGGKETSRPPSLPQSHPCYGCGNYRPGQPCVGFCHKELTAWLRAAGFTRIRTYGDMKLRRPADGAQRIYFVCERNQN